MPTVVHKRATILDRRSVIDRQPRNDICARRGGILARYILGREREENGRGAPCPSIIEDTWTPARQTRSLGVHTRARPGTNTHLVKGGTYILMEGPSPTHADHGWVRHSTPANAWVCRARNSALSNCLLPCRPGRPHFDLPRSSSKTPVTRPAIAQCRSSLIREEARGSKFHFRRNTPRPSDNAIPAPAVDVRREPLIRFPAMRAVSLNY